jgi:arylsulfatase
VLAAVGLHLVNIVRLDLTAFDDSAADLLERSRRIRDGARPAYEREALASLPTNANNGPVVHLADVLDDATVREMPAVSGTGDDSGIVLGWDFEIRHDSGLVPGRDLTKVEVRDGVLRVKHHADDYLTNPEPLSLPKDQIADIIIRARANRGSRMRLAWHGEGEPKSFWSNKVDTDLIGDDEFHTYVINAANVLKRGLATGENITKIMLVPSNEDGARVEIDFVRFVSKLAKYSQRPHGQGYETAGEELRRVLYMLPDQVLSWVVDVPAGAARFDFGTAVLVDGAPVRFEVSAVDGPRVEPVYVEEIAEATAWNDVSLDLSRWSGGKVELRLRVTGHGENVAFWSDPIISSEPRERFNVVVVLEDALRADHLSVYGYDEPTSPYKEKLAKNGVVFERAFSQATKTRASMPSLMTSLPPSATGVWNFADQLDDGYLTMAEILRRQGFLTAAFVQNGNAGPFAGMHQGFSQVVDHETLGLETDLILGDGCVTDWLEDHRDRNFFLYLHVMDPHGPYDPQPPFNEGWRDVPDGEEVEYSKFVDPEWIERPTVEMRRWLYDQEIKRNDSYLPTLFEKLESLGLRDNTLVVLTSDHGEYLGEFGLWLHHPPGRLPVIHVPIMFMYPDRFSGERRVPQTVQTLDIMPTILDLAGVERSELLMAGESLVDLVDGKRLDYWNDRIAISEEPYSMLRDDPFPSGSLFFRQWHIANSNRWWPTLFFGKTNPRPVPLRVRLYDFHANPAEDRMAWTFAPDLRVHYRVNEVMAEMQANHMDAWKKWTGGADETYRVDPDVLENLRKLGYVN